MTELDEYIASKESSVLAAAWCFACMIGLVIAMIIGTYL